MSSSSGPINWGNGASWYRDLFFDASGRVPRETWWVGVACLAALVCLFNVLATIVAFHVWPEFNVLDGRSIVARHRFAGWLIVAVFFLIAYPLYAVSIKRRRDRGASGWDLTLCLMLNGLFVLGQAFGTQWPRSYAGIGYAMMEVPSIPNLIVPTPTLAVQVASSLVTILTVAMIVPLGVLRGRDRTQGAPETTEPNDKMPNRLARDGRAKGFRGIAFAAALLIFAAIGDWEASSWRGMCPRT